MHKATPNNTSLRSYSSGGSRQTVAQVDDNTLMQEHAGTAMHSETRGGVESPQNYGFTSVCADEDDTGSAECHMSYSGGNRSFPVAGAMDDRRHRLRGLAKGDAAMNRGKNDDMQIHLAGDGMYHSAPQMVRVQLVPAGSGAANPPQQKQQASATKQRVYAAAAAKHGPAFEARLWAGLEPELQAQLDRDVDRLEDRPTVGALASGAGPSSGSQSQGGQQKTGQKAVAGAGADSKDFMHVKTAEGRLSSGKKVRLSKGKEDDDVLHETNQDGNDYCGGTPAKHKFSKVLTLDGPAKNVYGRKG